MDKKKGFANTHYPGIKADPNEGRLDIPKIALEFLKPLIDRYGVEVQRKIWDKGILLIGLNERSLDIAETLVRAGVSRIGFLQLKSTDQMRAEMKRIFSLLREKYSWVTFEPFAGLSLDRDVEDVVKGFQLLIECSEVGTDRTIAEAASRLNLKNLAAAALLGMSFEDVVETISN